MRDPAYLDRHLVDSMTGDGWQDRKEGHGLGYELLTASQTFVAVLAVVLPDRIWNSHLKNACSLAKFMLD